VQTLVGFGAALVVLVGVANLVAVHYVGLSMRAAADAGARAGALVGGSTDSCAARAEAVLRGPGGLLRGPYGSEVGVDCRRIDGSMEATASVVLRWWWDVLGPIPLRVTSESVLEDVPATTVTASPQLSGSWP
jgi:hypothetical protein